MSKKPELRWHDLTKEPPQGDGGVILFPEITNVGHLFWFNRLHVISNPEYARLHALEKGYTHWFPIPKHPDEDKIREKIKKLYEPEAIADREFHKGFERATENIIEFLKGIVPDRPSVILAVKARFEHDKKDSGK